MIVTETTAKENQVPRLPSRLGMGLLWSAGIAVLLVHVAASIIYEHRSKSESANYPSEATCLLCD
jgi:hypothetical protein